MSDINETIYPQYPKRFTEKTLRIEFTPTVAEKRFVRQSVKNATSRCLLQILLCSAQYLKYVPKPNTIPTPIIKHVIKCINYSGKITKKQLLDYQQSGSFKRHSTVVRRYLNFENDTEKVTEFSKKVAHEVTQVQENLEDIINAIIQLLIRAQFELPTFNSLVKLARHCRLKSYERYYDQILRTLSQVQIEKINKFFVVPDGDTTSPWNRLKEDPGKATEKHIKAFIIQFDWIQYQAQYLPNVHCLPIAKKKQFQHEATSLHSNEMRRIKRSKRYALAVVLIQMRYANALDSLTSLFIKVVQKIQNAGMLKYQQNQLENKDSADHLIGEFRDILYLYQNEPIEEKVNSVAQVLSKKGGSLLEQCDQHLISRAFKEKPYIVKAYRNKRSLVLNLLSKIPFECDIQFKFIKDIQTFLSTLVGPPEQLLRVVKEKINLSTFSENWQGLIRVSETDQDVTINQYALEIAWLIELKEQLKTFHCYIPNASQYGNPDEQKISEERYNELIEKHSEITGMPTEGKELVIKLKSELIDLVRDLDCRFPTLPGVRINDNALIITPAYKHYKSSTIESLKSEIEARSPQVSIIDVIADTVRWLRLDKLFGPFSGFKGRIQDHLFRLVINLFCHGCNVGEAQTSRSINGLTARQIGWLNSRHINIDKLDLARKKVVNKHQAMDLPNQWGDGTHASADGTHRKTYEANLLSETHFRYQLKGAIGYYMVSDKMIGLFSNLISCGAHESWHILDGLADNDMDIKPTIIHGDTHSQNYIVFALAYLLGIRLMPRIRGVGDLVFFKPTAKTKVKNIGCLFRGDIKWKYIEKYLPEMLRIALSVSEGLMQPSMILRRLNSRNKRDHLFIAFQELGKVARTLFLLRYISDIDMRKMIHAETNKSEQYNNFLEWLFFGNGGIIRENNLVEQEKIVKYNHLVSDLVILYNTHHMTRILSDLKKEGYPVVKEDLAHISPFHNYGINLLGSYNLDVERDLEEIASKLEL